MNYNSLNSSSDGHRIWGNNYNSNNLIENSNSSYYNNLSDNLFTITRDKLVQLPRSMQFDIFRKLSNTNKLSIFSDKIKLIISSENLETAEIEHLTSVLKFFKPEYYNENYRKLVDDFYVKWKDTAIKKFNWSLERILFYVEMWMTKQENETSWNLQNLIHSIPNSDYQVVPDAGKKSCECSYNIACPGAGNNCEKDNCNKKSGCGFFGHASCTGRCSNSDILPSS